jgi:hypothetical protein
MAGSRGKSRDNIVIRPGIWYFFFGDRRSKKDGKMDVVGRFLQGGQQTGESIAPAVEIRERDVGAIGMRTDPALGHFSPRPREH